MKKVMKRLAITSVLAMSILAVMPVGASAEWKKDSNQKYYWVENGVKAKGWKLINGEWYNFRNDGVMEVSWVQDKGNWYYLWSNGMMASNCWLNKAGGWYYFDATGKMIYDSTVVGARQYDFTKPAFIISKDLENNTGTPTVAENKASTSTSTSATKTTSDTKTADNTTATSTDAITK